MKDLLFDLLSVTGMAFAQEVGPVLQQSPVQQDLFYNIDASEMTEEEMAGVEGEGVLWALILGGAGVWAGSALVPIIETALDQKLPLWLKITAIGSGCAIGAVIGAFLPDSIIIADIPTAITGICTAIGEGDWDGLTSVIEALKA